MCKGVKNIDEMYFFKKNMLVYYTDRKEKSKNLFIHVAFI